MDADGIARDGMLEGDLVVITGAGGGFGQAFARRMAKMGARLSLWDIDAEAGQKVAAGVRASGADVQFVHVDLADAAAIERAVDSTLSSMGTPYCIINNASVFPRGEILQLSLADWELTMKVNVTAPFHIVKLFGPGMIEAGRGVVINLASGRGIEGAPKGANYACSKAAMISLTKSLALEWAAHGIRVNTIIPGQALTAMPMAATPREQLIENAKTRVPLGRIAYPDDMAGLAAFLVSADAAFMTGQGVAMNGGVVMVP